MCVPRVSFGPALGLMCEALDVHAAAVPQTTTYLDKDAKLTAGAVHCLKVWQLQARQHTLSQQCPQLWCVQHSHSVPRGRLSSAACQLEVKLGQ